MSESNNRPPRDSKGDEDKLTPKPQSSSKPHDYHDDHDEHDDGDHEEHIDERWLVSYSDMMTLLFGLFVMLYSLAMEHKGNIDSQLQKIQQTESSKETTEPVGPSPEELKKEIADRQLMIQDLESKLTTTENRLQELGIENELLKKSSSVAEELSQSLAELQKTKIDLDRRTQELSEASQEIDRLKSRLPASENKFEVLQAELKKRTSELASIQEQLRASQENTMKPEEIKRLKEIERENSTIKSELQAAIKKLEVEKTDKNSGDFLLIVLTWSTEKHDLDMVIKDPQGHDFDFQNRTHTKIPGEFVVDSRTGPGIEVFQAANPIKGNYEVKFDFYNAYGNKQDAEVKVSILTRSGEKKLPAFKLNRDSSKTKTYKFSLGEKGAIHLL